MRIDGFSPTHLPAPAGRSDVASGVADRQEENRNQLPAPLSGAAGPRDLQVVSPLQAQAGYERYQEHKANFSSQEQLSWQNRQAMASYAAAASLDDEDSTGSGQVLGLDIYA